MRSVPCTLLCLTGPCQCHGVPLAARLALMRQCMLDEELVSSRDTMDCAAMHDILDAFVPCDDSESESEQPASGNAPPSPGVFSWCMTCYTRWFPCPCS